MCALFFPLYLSTFFLCLFQIIEILKLVKRELSGESTRSVWSACQRGNLSNLTAPAVCKNCHMHAAYQSRLYILTALLVYWLKDKSDILYPLVFYQQIEGCDNLWVDPTLFSTTALWGRLSCQARDCHVLKTTKEPNEILAQLSHDRYTLTRHVLQFLVPQG